MQALGGQRVFDRRMGCNNVRERKGMPNGFGTDRSP
jgi:hypothetical protein